MEIVETMKLRGCAFWVLLYPVDIASRSWSGKTFVMSKNKCLNYISLIVWLVFVFVVCICKIFVLWYCKRFVLSFQISLTLCAAVGDSLMLICFAAIDRYQIKDTPDLRDFNSSDLYRLVFTPHRFAETELK